MDSIQTRVKQNIYCQLRRFNLCFSDNLGGMEVNEITYILLITDAKLEDKPSEFFAINSL